MKRKLSPWCKEVKKTLIDRDAGIQNTASTCSYKEHVNGSVYGGNVRLVRRDG